MAKENQIKEPMLLWANAVLLGANWDNSGNAGARASNWNNEPWNSNDNVGARGLCDRGFTPL